MKILKKLKISGLNTIITKYKNGLDTLVSDRGHNFSGGQAQRISIARTIYKITNNDT